MNVIRPHSPGSSLPPSPREVHKQDPPSAPIHRLADIKLEELKGPYRKEDIAAYLKEHQVGETGVHALDDCLFQSVLFTDFFEKIEAGEIKPDQPEYDDKPAKYLLKKSVELLKPLDVKIDEANQRYNNMVENAPVGSTLHANLEKELAFVKGMVARFQTLERNLLDALAQPHDFRPTRDKACFLLFAHAMLADAANDVQRWMTDLAAAEPGAEVIPPSISPGVFRDEEMVLSYVTHSEGRSNLFSAEPLTPEDRKLYEKGLSPFHKFDDGMRKMMVPSFSPTGSQGVLAILHCIFHGNGLLTGATRQPYPVHSNHFKGSHLATLRHDCLHVQNMFKSQVLSSIPPKLMPIYSKLENPASNLPADAVKKDLVVLFFVLHEITGIFDRPEPTKSFLDYAQGYMLGERFVVDAVALLDKVGVSIPGIDKNSSSGEMVKHYKTIAQAMNDLWKDFRQRHAEDLKVSGLLDALPRFAEG